MSYHRVIPRDLFNESKLLKCLGRLALLVNDGMAGSLQIDFDGESFDIRREDSSGGLYCHNFKAFIKRYKDKVFIKNQYIGLESSLNSMDNYPLWFFTDGMNEYERVFNEDGSFTDAFKSLIGV